MNRVGLKLLFFAYLILVSSKPIFAATQSSTSSAVVSATIIGTSFSAPILISPSDNAITNNPREPLVWQRPSPLPSTPLHHYDVYLDGQLFATSISDSINTQAYYFYNIRRVGNTFYLEPQTDLSQGYHTWSVKVYDTNGLSVSSETRTFYLDSIAPFIKLEKVNTRNLNWDTSIPSSIPDKNNRALSVNNSNPLLTGKIEPFDNMQIDLICPQNIPNCQNQSFQGNYPTGIWQHRFYGLIRGLVYTVFISATDAAGNSTIFTEFYLAYGVVSPTPSATISVTPTQTPEVPSTITPEITPEIVVPPIPFTPIPPIAPTPPPITTTSPVTPNFIIKYWYLLLLVIGLPLHVMMAMIGTQTSISQFFKFVFTLLFPFLGKKEYQTTPLSTIQLYELEKLNSTWQTKISNINGFYHLPTSTPNQLFVKINCAGRHWNNIIVNNSILPITCLIPLLEDHQTPTNRLAKIIMRTRSLPLAVACLTSGFALIIQPNYFFLIYLYLSLQFAFSEYLYPKLSK